MKTNCVAVILSGCGVMDGTEIHEAVLTLLEIDRSGVKYDCLSLDIMQSDVIDHSCSAEDILSQRNVMKESARISRGQITNIKQADINNYDALFVPGGFGAAKNLCDYAFKGASLTVNQDILDFSMAMHNAGKPIGLMCIAPVMAPKIFGVGVRCTIGTDPNTAAHIEAIGGIHVKVGADQIVVDTSKRLVTTPGYMTGESITSVSLGISKMVQKVLSMI